MIEQNLWWFLEFFERFQSKALLQIINLELEQIAPTLSF